MNIEYDIPAFQQYWNMKVKPLALKCCEGADLTDRLGKATTQEEIDDISRQMEKYGRKDWDSASCINKMIQDVENLGTNGNDDPVAVIYNAILPLDAKNYHKKISILRDNKEVRTYKKLNEVLYDALEWLVL